AAELGGERAPELAGAADEEDARARQSSNQGRAFTRPFLPTSATSTEWKPLLPSGRTTTRTYRPERARTTRATASCGKRCVFWYVPPVSSAARSIVVSSVWKSASVTSSAKRLVRAAARLRSAASHSSWLLGSFRM